MTSPNLYDFSEYREYLRAYFEAFDERGNRSAFAKALGCQLSYLTRVLAMQAHLSPEQADSASRFLGHSTHEMKYFFVFVLYSRAGTSSLRDRLKKDLDEMKLSRLLLKNRTQLRQSLSVEDQITYYSRWHYAAIHVAISIPELQTVESISNYFRLSPRIVRQVLKFLSDKGIALQKGHRFKVGETQLHLHQDSGLISKHHQNLRIEAIKSLDRQTDRDMHYSSLVSVSEADLPRIREILIQAIEEVRSVVRESKDEKVACYCLDLFTLG